MAPFLLRLNVFQRAGFASTPISATTPLLIAPFLSELGRDTLQNDMTAQRSTTKAIGVLVLGMHRSGTSAVTGVLDKLGIPVAGELLGAESYNKKGLFENKAVNLFHNRLLAHLGSRWDDPMPVSNDFVATPAGQGFITELAAIIKDELLADAAIFAVKDPRMCRFIPLWQAALERSVAEPRAIIPLRHPLDVAGSLAARDGFPRAKSFLLWLDHTLAAERQTRDINRSIIGYDTLLADWRGTSDKLAHDLDLAWPKERSRVEHGVDEFLSRDLRHHANSAEIGEATRLDALVSKSWSALNILVEDPGNAEAQASLDAVHAELVAATSVLTPYVTWEFSALADALSENDRLQFQEKALRQERQEFETSLRQVMADTEANLRNALKESEEAHRQALRTEQRSFRQKLKASEDEMQALRRRADEADQLDRRIFDLENENQYFRREVQEERVALAALKSSTSWRMTAPLRSAVGLLSPSTKNVLRRSAKAGWWAVTPWRTSARLRFLREREQQALAASSARPLNGETSAQAHETSPQVATPPRRGASSQPPLRIFEVAGGSPRISMVTDSINAGSLFGGVATALIFTALLAKQTGRSLRIITRTQPPEADNVATVFRAHGIAWTDNIDFVFADLHDKTNQIDVHADELFVTTSWWTTQATRQTIADTQILYILQEDERMFYPFGDDYLACSEVISDRAIAKVINSELLHRHLVQDGVIDAATPFFEPSFPKRIYYPAPDTRSQKRNFFFYARPYNARNLYERGIEVIEAALERGILDPDEWNIHFVGKDLAPTLLSGGVEPILLQNLAWEDYADFVRSVDLALTLMYTPHPSYPPLDVAACGGVAVTNRFGVKTDLSHYSRSILCADSELEALVEGLKQGVQKATDRKARDEALASSQILRDWPTSFAPVFEKIVEGRNLVH